MSAEKINEAKPDFEPVADIFDQKLLSKIKGNKLSPTPRWHFLLKNYVIWVVGGLSLLIGAGAVSVLTYLTINNDLQIHHVLNKTWGEVMLLTLPYFWLIFLGLFILVIYYNIKHTKRGYRYPLWAVLVVAILSSVILGEGLFLLGVGEKIDSIFSRRAPLYARLINPQLEFWSQPAEGRLVGLPMEILEDEGEGGGFTLVDCNKKEWQIIPASSTVNEILENMPLRGDIQTPPIRLLGEEVSEGVFIVEKIMPLMPGKAFFERPGHGHRLPGPPGLPLPPMPDGQHSFEDKPTPPKCWENKKDGSGNDANDLKEDKRPCVVTDEGVVRSQPSSKN